MTTRPATTNPWLRLATEPPFILPEDAALIRRFEGRLTGDYSIQPDILPEPFYGSRSTSKVVLLALNPGFQGCEIDLASAHPEFAAQNRKILTFESRYPFFHLDPAHAFHPGHKWWRPRLERLIEEHGLDTVTSKLMVVQLFPYHSKAFRAMPEVLPSQEFSFELVDEAVRAQKVIVIMRSRELWLKAVPSLRDYPFIELRFPRNPRLAPHHMPDGDYARLSSALS